MVTDHPRRSPVEITNPNAVYADPQARGELREALAVLLAHERAGKLSAWGLADALLSGPLAPLLAKLAAVEALADSWTYKGEFGWGSWHEGQGPDGEGQVLDHAASEIRRALNG